MAPVDLPDLAVRSPAPSTDAPAGPPKLLADDLRAWFGESQALRGITLSLAPREVTAIIGPSGCGKSTFVRCLNRLHELVPGARVAGRVLLDGQDVYAPRMNPVRLRRHVGMVFQKANPFPTMSIRDNVLAGPRLTGEKLPGRESDVVERALRQAALWDEVKDRLDKPGASLSGGQQQRLCIARALALEPDELLMDEPCSALDPTSTRRIEETIGELSEEVTIVIVTHNMQQAQRVSQSCAFFLAEQGQPGHIVEHGPTDLMFSEPQDPRTFDYVNGRFG